MVKGKRGADSDAVVIKKYGNRRLYDTSQSRYITLEDLAEVVRAGRQVRVVDAKGGADLTRAVLTQVILEQQDRLEMIPVELLAAIIRAQGTLQQAPLGAWLADLSRQLTAAGSQWAQLFGGWLGSPQSTAPSPGPDEPPQTGSDELEQLRFRMDELLNRLDKKV